MDDNSIIDLLGGTMAVARLLGTSGASISEWRRNGIPELRLVELAASIEQAGGPRRCELRPDDWHRIWPELVGKRGMPKVPAEAA